MIKFLKNLFGKEISGQNKDVNRDTQDDKIIEAIQSFRRRESCK